jgi:hypothetical protein
LCVIDNTSVVVVDGTGADAVMAPEMVAFGRTLGCHRRHYHSAGARHYRRMVQGRGPQRCLSDGETPPAAWITTSVCAM